MLESSTIVEYVAKLTANCTRIWYRGERGTIRNLPNYPPTYYTNTRRRHTRPPQPAALSIMSPVVTWSIALQLVCSSSKVTSLHPAFAITASALRIRFRYLARSGGNRPASLLPHPCPHSRPLSKAWFTSDYTNVHTAPQSPTHIPSTTQPPTTRL